MLVRIATLAIVLLIAMISAGCGGEEDASPVEEAPTTQAPAATDDGGKSSAGRDLFVTTCGGCHTLADAGTNGQVGPNLDEASVDLDDVAIAIETGPGNMPSDLLSEDDERKVAEYVAAHAGR